ncbi:MAG: aminotransferase class I/II-fold pyridoxal phosphate-dependent enzyme [Bacteroidales bacterium]|nr:MAG: aminotransferase class I/II-fold pyridoxal phosphate-dependent enzyme [Bacteroidales bacterium]
MKKDVKFETKAVRTRIKPSTQKEHSLPIYETSSFIFDNAEEGRALFAEEKVGHIYTRYSNPTNDEFIMKLCALEEAEDGLATTSGMAAIFSSFVGHLKAGDHLLACRSLFGSTHQIITRILPRFGISHTYVDINDNDAWEKNIMPTTRMIFAETPSNPGLDIIDLEMLGKLAEKHNLLLVVDNTFATPYIQQPVKYGTDIIIHSTTKFIDGQGRTIGGAVIGKEKFIEDIRFIAKHTGPCISPFDAWILSKSLETLALRMDRHCDNAYKLAVYLEENQEIKWVKYPFLPSYEKYELAKKQMKSGGGLVTMELKGGAERAKKFIDSLELLSLTTNLGDTRTIVTHPATTTHSKLTEEERQAVNITRGLIRISVGVEHIEDIIADIEQAIKRSK